VPHGQSTIFYELSNLRRQFQQPDRVRHRAAIFADAVGDLVLREAKLVDKALERSRFLQRSQIRALQIIDKCALECAAGIDFLNDYRNFTKSCSLRGSPTALARDEKVPTPVRCRSRSNHQRGDYTVSLDRLG